MVQPPRPRRLLPLVVVGYVVLVVVIIGAMIWAKHSVGRLASPDSVSDWQSWRADVQKEQQHPGPVERRIPKSAEPPALVLLRDNFAVLMFGALLFSSVLYWIIAWFVLGILKPQLPQN